MRFQPVTVSRSRAAKHRLSMTHADIKALTELPVCQLLREELAKVEKDDLAVYVKILRGRQARRIEHYRKVHGIGFQEALVTEAESRLSKDSWLGQYC